MATVDGRSIDPCRARNSASFVSNYKCTTTVLAVQRYLGTSTARMPVYIRQCFLHNAIQRHLVFPGKASDIRILNEIDLDAASIGKASDHPPKRRDQAGLIKHRRMQQVRNG